MIPSTYGWITTGSSPKQGRFRETPKHKNRPSETIDNLKHTPTTTNGTCDCRQLHSPSGYSARSLMISAYTV
jgi:hypothetical protein